MGRYYYTIGGNVDIRGKYAFAKQCSNLGTVARMYMDDVTEVFVNGEVGEVIHFYGDAKEVVEWINRAIDSVSRFGCSVCGCSECKEATVEMLRKILELIDESGVDVVDMWIFAEY